MNMIFKSYKQFRIQLKQIILPHNPQEQLGKYQLGLVHRLKLMNCLLCAFVLLNNTAAEAAVFSIIPQKPLPTEVSIGGVVTAYYTITNTTEVFRPENFIQRVPENTSQIVSPFNCGQTFNLNPNQNCTLQLNITGASDGIKTPLFACLKNCKTCCAGTLFPLKIKTSSLPVRGYFAVINGVNQNTIVPVTLPSNELDTPIEGFNFFKEVPAGVTVASNVQKVYVTDLLQNQVKVIDSQSLSVIQTIPVNLFPVGTAFSSRVNKVYVSNGKSHNISVIDVSTNIVTNTITLDTLALPGAIGISIDGTKAYVTDESENAVWVIDTNNDNVVSKILVGQMPFEIGFTPDGTQAYVPNSADNTISVIDLLNNTVIRTISNPNLNSPVDIEFSLNGQKYYVSNSNTSAVSVFSTTDDALITNININGNPAGISFNPTMTALYVTSNSTDYVSVIDPNTNTVVSTINVGGAQLVIGKFIG